MKKLRVGELDRISRVADDLLHLAEDHWKVACVVVRGREEEGRTTGTTLEKLRMVTHLPELHHQVHQTLHLRLRLEHLEEILDRKTLLYVLSEK